MKVYIAEFPAKWGSQITRSYKSRATALRVAKTALKRCLCPMSPFCQVWEYDRGTRKKTLIYDSDFLK